MELLGLAQTGHLWLYFVLVFGIIALPGVDMAYVIGSSLTGGKTSGLAAVAGIAAGGICHTVMGFAGIGALLQVLPAAFNVLLLAGSAYVGWIGWSLLRSASFVGEVTEIAPATLATTFARGAMTCLLNPKAYIFTLAVMPQFVRPDYGAIVPQVVVIGFITAATQVVVYGAIAFGAAGLRQNLRSNEAAQVRLGQTVGSILIATAVWTAYQSWR